METNNENLETTEPKETTVSTDTILEQIENNPEIITGDSVEPEQPPIKKVGRKKGQTDKKPRKRRKYKKSGKYTQKAKEAAKQPKNDVKQPVDSEYEDVFKDFDNNLDPDAKNTPNTDSEGEQPTDSNPNELTDTPEQERHYSGKSLIFLTDLLQSIIGKIAVRVITKGKIKVTRKDMKYDDFTKEILEEFGDDAADEILGTIPPAYVYFTLALASTADNVMEKVDLMKQQQKNGLID